MRSLALLLFLAAAPAQAHMNDWYMELKDKNGQSCCSFKDCRRVDMCSPAGGGEGLAIEGKCIKVPYDKVLDTSSPDGEAHACWYNYQGESHILCVILMGGA
jgi:hypothetical protein